ncbi:MAG: hypothetical protein GEU99_06760 [Luteitalea sp.]|nr:hypothetical protein [Luteitalea sp.]
MTEQEQKAIERQEGFRWRHPTAKEVRQRTSPTLEAVYAAPGARTSGNRIYYVEATKRYKRQPGDRDADCDVLSFIHGWVHADKSDRVAAARIGAEVTACDYNSVAIMHPLGVLHLNAKRLWVVQWSTWGHEQYEILDPASRKLEPLFATTAGVCSQ